MATVAELDNQEQMFGHPKGLFVLFFTEMWERFSYYGMRAMLILYMIGGSDHLRGAGLGWTKTEAYMLYGWYVMLVYVLSIPGGILADKLLGQKKTVMVGAFTLVAGHGVLAVDAIWAFFLGLGLIILGVGMLKPNISTMVGGLYKSGDIRRDKGFSIFYMGINLGSLLATLSIGFIADKWGWHAGFGTAGVAMLFGLIFYIKGQKHLTFVGNKREKEDIKKEISIGSLFGNLLKSPLHLVITLVLIAVSSYFGISMKAIDKWGYVALFIFISLVVGLMMMIYKDLENQILKDRFLVMLLSFLLVVVFWGAFEQAGGLMSVYTEEKTNRDFLGLFTIPTEMFQSLNAGFILLFAVWIANIWAKRKVKNKEASSLFKMAIGTIIMGLGFIFMILAATEYESSGSSSMIWLVLAYLFHTIGELCSSPVSLSFVTKLAPARYASLMMGLYFAATGFGGKVAGVIGEKSEQFGEYAIFIGVTVFTVVFAGIVIALLKPLKRLTHGAEDLEGTSNEEVEGFELAE